MDKYHNFVFSWYQMKAKFSTIAAGIAAIVVIAAAGIVGVIGQQQQTALAARTGPHFPPDVIEREICPGQIFVRVDGIVFCLPRISVDLSPE